MARKLNQQLRATWRKRIERQGQSGQTVAEFCRREGVTAANFYYWKRQLRTDQSRRSKGTTRRRKTVSSKRHQVKGPDGPAGIPFVQLPLPAPPACPWIEVVLAEGTIVRLPQQNLAALQAVLGAIGNGAQPPSIEGVRYA